MALSTSLKTKAIETISRLPLKRLREVIDFAEYLERRERLDESKEILENRELLEGIKIGLDEIKNGKCKSWQSVRKNV